MRKYINFSAIINDIERPQILVLKRLRKKDEWNLISVYVCTGCPRYLLYFFDISRLHDKIRIIFSGAYFSVILSFFSFGPYLSNITREACMCVSLYLFIFLSIMVSISSTLNTHIFCTNFLPKSKRN
jgi:hypothetical protein